MERMIMEDVDGRCFYISSEELASAIEEMYDVSPPEIITVEEFIEWLIKEA